MDGQEPEITEEIQEVTEEHKEEPKVEPDVKDITPKSTDPKWYVEKIGKMTGKLYAERAEKEKLKEELKKYKTEQPAPKAPVPNQFIDAYGNLDETNYQKAMGDFVDKHSQYKREVEEAKVMDDQYKERLQERIDIFNSQVAELRKDVPDIDQIITKPIWSQIIGKPLEYAIYESDESAKLADYLGRNEGEIHKLNSMSVPKMLEQIGRLEEKFAFQEKKRSTAPEPISPLDSRNGKLTQDTNEITDDNKWFEERKKEKLRKLKGK